MTSILCCGSLCYSRYPSQKDEVAYDFEYAKDRIIGQKNHVVRTMAQEKCKEDILANLLFPSTFDHGLGNEVFAQAI